MGAETVNSESNEHVDKDVHTFNAFDWPSVTTNVTRRACPKESTVPLCPCKS